MPNFHFILQPTYRSYAAVLCIPTTPPRWWRSCFEASWTGITLAIPTWPGSRPPRFAPVFTGWWIPITQSIGIGLRWLTSPQSVGRSNRSPTPDSNSGSNTLGTSGINWRIRTGVVTRSARKGYDNATKKRFVKSAVEIDQCGRSSVVSFRVDSLNSWHTGVFRSFIPLNHYNPNWQVWHRWEGILQTIEY